MFFEVLLFLLLGILIGIIFGLLPGIHPNTIILFIPMLASLNLEPFSLLAFIAAIAVANNTLSFLPSILLGVPESGNELSVLPGHRMLLNGYGYQAVKLTIVGSIGAVILCVAIFPLMMHAIPFLFTHLSGYIYLFLIAIAAIMILTEEGKKKLIALSLFIVSGFIGLISVQLPIDNTIILFPIFSGFFGVSMLLLQIRNKVEIPKQSCREAYVSKGLINRSIISGSVAGTFSGLLPGVGASEIATLASIGKNEHAFLMKIGAITTANIVLSILALWLIGKSRSGIAVVVEQLVAVGFDEVLLILVTALASAGIASICATVIAKKSIYAINRFEYRNLGTAVLIFILLLTFAFANVYGMLLLAVCSAIGIITNFTKVKRGVLMGVLMIPTIIFYS